MTNRFQDAIQIQDACNPSGVAMEIVKMIRNARDENARAEDDPAVRLAVMKLADLCGIAYSSDDYSDAYADATRLSETV